jgi:hypothetical protein
VFDAEKIEHLRSMLADAPVEERYFAYAEAWQQYSGTDAVFYEQLRGRFCRDRRRCLVEVQQAEAVAR